MLPSPFYVEVCFHFQTYRDFHADLYPDTAGCVSDLTPSDWMSGKNVVIPKISLDPAKKENENKVDLKINNQYKGRGVSELGVSYF